MCSEAEPWTGGVCAEFENDDNELPLCFGLHPATNILLSGGVIACSWESICCLKFEHFVPELDVIVTVSGVDIHLSRLICIIAPFTMWAGTHILEHFDITRCIWEQLQMVFSAINLLAYISKYLMDSVWLIYFLFGNLFDLSWGCSNSFQRLSVVFQKTVPIANWNNLAQKGFEFGLRRCMRMRDKVSIPAIRPTGLC